jgi:two-component system, OmpR family, sensor histidine kinase ArlS
MSIRVKITLLFTMIMFLLLSLLCGSIYYFSYNGRIKNMKTHLTNRALVTLNMLDRPGIFDEKLMNKIDSTILRTKKNKSIQAYNSHNEKIYTYIDEPADTLTIPNNILDEARAKNNVYFTIGEKEAIAYNDNKNGLVVVAAAFDERGKKNLRRLQLILGLSFIGGIGIAFTSGYFFSKKLLRPIRKIADEVNIISAQSLAHRIKSGKGNDEWHYLTDTLNDLLNRLQESFEIQRRFISSASHELSTPLTSISSQLEVSLKNIAR